MIKPHYLKREKCVREWIYLECLSRVCAPSCYESHVGKVDWNQLVPAERISQEWENFLWERIREKQKNNNNNNNIDPTLRTRQTLPFTNLPHRQSVIAQWKMTWDHMNKTISIASYRENNPLAKTKHPDSLFICTQKNSLDTFTDSELQN